jgi:GH25 family lysozyme M1 (1,4-beta-N-acetylmuramidase)
MAFLDFIDVSRWQGNIDWHAVRNAGIEGAIIKISGGDDGLYYDPKASQNYYAAKGAGLLVGGYHFAGHTNPVTEAEFFVNGMKPFVENDVFVLDYDSDTGDAVGWCDAFVNRVHELTGVWCIIYVNGSTRNAHDWTPVAAKCGFWIAWYGKDPNQDLPVDGTYVMHQYTSSGQVAGVAGNVDMDAVYMSPEQFSLYGFHEPVVPVTPPVPVIPPPTPEPTPVPVPEPTPEPIPTPVPTPDPVPTPEPQPVPVPVPAPQPQESFLEGFIKVLLGVFVAFWNILKKGK